MQHAVTLTSANRTPETHELVTPDGTVVQWVNVAGRAASWVHTDLAVPDDAYWRASCVVPKPEPRIGLMRFCHDRDEADWDRYGDE